MAKRSDDNRREYTARLNQMVLDAKTVMDGHHREFDRSWKFYHGDHTEGLDIGSDEALDWLTVNVILSNTETRIPVLLDAAPTWFVAAPDDKHEDAAQELQKWLQAVAQRQSLSAAYEMVLRDQIVIGNGALKAWWNPAAGPKVPVAKGREGEETYTLEPQGDICIDWQDPYGIYPDPAARSLAECEYLALATDMAGDRAARVYDGFDPEEAEVVTFDNETKGGEGFLSSAGKWLKNTFTSGSTSDGGQRHMYRIWEMYHDGGAKLTIFSGSNILYDGDNPMPNGSFPIVMFRLYPTGYDFWSHSETLQVAALQQSIDRDLYRMSAHARETSNTPWVVWNEPNVKIENKPGAIIHLSRPDARIERVAPPAQPNSSFNLLNLKFELLDKVTGVHDVNRGLRPGGVQSGIGIQQVLETALTRLRSISRRNGSDLEKLGQLVLEMGQGNYAEDRTMTYMDGEKPGRVTVGPSQFHRPIADLSLLGPESGDGFGMETETEPIDYRVLVQAGGDLPLNAMAKAELAARAAQTPADDGRPMIDREAYLEAIQFPGRQEVMQRMGAAMQQQMQGQGMAMQQQGMLPGQQGPAGPMADSGGAMGQPGMEAAPAPMAGPEGVPPQGSDAEAVPLEELLQLLTQFFTPEEIEMIRQIIIALEGGQMETPEMTAFLAGLEPEKLNILVQVLKMAGVQLPTE